MPIYTNKVVWKGGHMGYTYCENGCEMEFSAPPSLYGHPNVMTPEDAFVMSINTCLHMMIIWAAERFKLDMVSLESTAEGEVEEHLDRTSWFKRVVVRPHIKVRGASVRTVERMLQMARKYSTIAESVKSEVVIEPEIEIV